MVDEAPTADAPGGFTIGGGEPGDADALLAVYVAARTRDAGFPPPTHGPDLVAAHLAELLAEHAQVWVAHAAGAAQPIGYAVVQDDWLHSLYVHPDHVGQGIGTALLDLVKALHPDGFELAVLESNRVARAFYARRGMVVVGSRQGFSEGPDEQEPATELHLVWPGLGPPAR